jgi:hypothetical protein
MTGAAEAREGLAPVSASISRHLSCDQETFQMSGDSLETL